MWVETKKVKGRRKVRYDTFDDLVADAERLAAVDVTSLGNWSLGQTLKHLGTAMESSIAGTPFRVNWKLRLLGRIFIKRLLVKGPFPAGFRLPRSAEAKLVPQQATTAEGLAALRQGIARLHSANTRIAHPVAGPLSIAEWNSFHLRHAEMHMSFLLPQADAPRAAPLGEAGGNG